MVDYQRLTKTISAQDHFPLERRGGGGEHASSRCFAVFFLSKHFIPRPRPGQIVFAGGRGL
jgi:hypothetical protein